ncbi:DUF4488 domain-containing protein [Plebeiibacterium sediminum]|uniref:DUF4488 domain-containing protein n=1 Tax=Plebeiibacterium sediminum TaxID=2992112 RepID=A0AAE3M2P7_9BACT|nr:DUF4488 domain-containing protein [Plebeiobacterium sediminum]MCW3786008.1 DUF4488 domain-containing protein [Plebeiobacterium sediminum]
MKNSIFKSIILIACIVFPCVLFAQSEKNTSKQQLNLQKRIDGKWQMCNADSTINIINGMTSYKIYSKGNYSHIKVIEESNSIALSIWGNYSLNNDVYDESPMYVTPNISSVSGNHFHFKLKIDGDYLVIKGINNGFNELWKRVN